MKLKFPTNSQKGPWHSVTEADWTDWRWQMRQSLRSEMDFAKYFELSDAERLGFAAAADQFQVRTTPYYAQLAEPHDPADPVRKILMPHGDEVLEDAHFVFDPLGERGNSRTSRLVHRFSDRVLFLVTDVCGVYCRYCTRKHFTAGNEAFMPVSEYEASLEYIRSHTGIREVILSGGDPLTLSDSQLDKILSDLRNIDHIEIIRIGSRMPVINPFRLTEALVKIFRKHSPVFLMTHFNHPRELTAEAATALGRVVDHGVPVFNQMVLLRGVNDSAALVQALSRRLLYLRVKPYYMFQCDPSKGTDHLRTSLRDSLRIQRELWGHLSGLAMPALSLDIPGGGGKVTYAPNFEIRPPELRLDGCEIRTYRGWDGVNGIYTSPNSLGSSRPGLDFEMYQAEWDSLVASRNVPSEFESLETRQMSQVETLEKI